MNKLPAQKVDGLIDGMELLEELASYNEPVSGLLLAKNLNMNPVRVNRLLKTFAYLGYAYRTSSRKYAPGPALHILAVESMARSGLLRRAYKYLELLKKKVPLVALGVLWRDKVCYLYHHDGKKGMGSGLNPDLIFDWKHSSVGHALMAERDELPADLAPELYEEIEKTRRNGYALIKFRNHYTMAMTIGKPAYAALAISGIKTLDEAKSFLILLKQYVNEITLAGNMNGTKKEKGNGNNQTSG